MRKIDWIKFNASAGFAWLFLGWGAACAAPASPAGAEEQVRQADAAFWKAYNACDIPAMGAFFTEDVEFYHDKGGLTRTRQGVVDSIKKGICGNPEMKIRRAPVIDSVQFRTLGDDHAMLIGDHQFYGRAEHTPEHLDGQAKFLDLWERKDGIWQMSRIVSYEHGPPPYTPPAEVVLTPAALKPFVGKYTSSTSGSIVVSETATHLTITTNKLVLQMFAQSENVFFARERDLHFEFLLGKSGDVVGVQVRENGAIVDHLVRI